MGDKIYLYDGSFEGMLTCVFEAYYRRENPAYIEPESDSQMRFGSDYEYIKTDEQKAERVFSAVKFKISPQAAHNVMYTYLSDAADKEKNILEYLRLGFRVGRTVDMRLAEDCVRFVAENAQRVGSEAHSYKGLVRFSELSDGAFYSEIEPKNNVLPILARHFASRLSGIPWIIFDLRRRLCCVYDTQKWYLHPTDSVRAELSDDEEKYRALWREFYNTIEIKERHNEKCRMTNMPKRYWAHLTELNCIGE